MCHHSSMSNWLADGRALGDSLRRFSFIAVAGGDRQATAEVALGIAEAQSAHRRVVLGDLLGDAERYAAMRDEDDAHGIVEALDFGISLSRVTRPVAGNARLHFAPTGSLLPDYRDFLAHARWRQIAGSFAEAGDLLIVAVPIDAPGLEDFVHRSDGLILVDSMAPARIDTDRVIATIRERRPSIPVFIPPHGAVMVDNPPSRVTPVGMAAQGPAGPPPQRPSRASIGAEAMNQRPTGVFTAFAKPVGLGAGLSILGAVLIFWLVSRPFDRTKPPVISGTQTVVRTPDGPTIAGQPAEADPADSAGAAYAVQIMAANTQAGAILKLQENSGSLPAATYSPVEIAGRTWFKVLAGAYATRAGADSLLTSLRASGLLDSLSPGEVVRVPYAVRVDSVRRSETVDDLLTSLRTGRQLPVYALEQEGGWVWIVAGAFETRSAADAYAEKIRAGGQPAMLVLRQGRMF